MKVIFIDAHAENAPVLWREGYQWVNDNRALALYPFAARLIACLKMPGEFHSLSEKHLKYRAFSC